MLGLVLGLLATTAAWAQPTTWAWEKDHDTDYEQRVNDVALDSLNHWVYAVGFYQESANQVFGLPASLGSSDAYLAKFDHDGNFIWSVRIGSTGADVANAVAVDQTTGRVYVTGTYKSTLSTTVATGTAPTTLTNAGGTDIFVACYTQAGGNVFFTKASGTNDDAGTGIAVNASGVFVTGQYTRSATFAGSTAITPTAGASDSHQHLFVANYPLDSGTPRWVINGVNGQANYMGKCAADGDNLYTTGSFNGSSLVWYNSAGAILNTMTAGTTRLNVLTLAVNNAGAVQWATAFTNPNSTTGAGNSVALSCGLVYVTGQIGNGSTFPGAGVITDISSGGTNYLFIAALRKDNGQTFAVKTAYSANFNGSTYGVDVSVTADGAVYLAGTFRQDVRFGTFGVQITQDLDRDIFLIRFTSYLQPEWIYALGDPGDEDVTALAVSNAKGLFMGGYYQEDLTLSPFTLDNDDPPAGLFLARTNDPDGAYYPYDPSKWHAPTAAICSNAGTVDLSTALRALTRGNATAVTAYDNTGTINPTNALGAANAAGAVLSGNNAYLTLDLGIAANVGDRLWITWMENNDLAAALGTATMQVEESYDGTAWTINPAVFTNQVNLLSPAYVSSVVNLSSDARYIRLRRMNSAITSNLNIDAVTYRTGNVLTGTWSGNGMTAAGVFDPTGLSGNIPVTYTVNMGTCAYSTTHNLTVTAAPGGGSFTGNSTTCPGTSSGTLSIAGQNGNVVRWEYSTDGFATSTIIASTASSITTPVMTQTTKYRVLLAGSGCPNAYSNAFVVTVQDVTPPSITCPADLSVNAGAGLCGANVTYALPVATDNCTASPSVGPVQAAQAPGSFFPVGTTNVTLKASDGYGNSSTCAFNITVIDNIAPGITCPADINVPAESALCGAHVTYTLPVGTDNCAGPVTVAPANAALAPGSVFPVGATTVQLRATDAAGNSTNCSFIVRVTDTTAPVMSCPANIAAHSEAGFCGAHVNYPLPTAIDACSGNVPVALANPAFASGSLFPIGTTTINFTATDGAGNTAACSFTITVTDDIPPAISCPADIAMNADPGMCGAVVNYALPVATDNCSSTTMVRTAGLASGSLFPVGTTTVTHRVTDLGGNSVDCSFNVTVVDTQSPQITCPPNVAVNSLPGQCGAVVTYTPPTGTDNCSSATTTRIAGPASGSTFPVGITTVTHRVTDATGLSTDCSFTVTVYDVELPTITCPGNISVSNAANTCGTQITFAAPVGTDNCSPATTTRIAGMPSGATFPVGTTVETYKVMDGASNFTTCSFNVTVNDVQPPTISCPADITVNNQPGACGAAVVYSTPTAADNCAGVSVVRTAGAASGSIFPVGNTTVTHRATDAAGNTADCSFVVHVNDTQAPSITCPADITVSSDTATCGAVVNYVAPIGTDNCGGASTIRTAGPASGALFPIGTTTVTHLVTDAAGLTASCSFSVTVTDNTPPRFACPASITTNVEAGLCGAHVTYVLPTATDNCSGVVSVVPVNSAYAPGSLFPVGTTTVQLRATDAAGNSSTCSFTVTVTDNIAPSISCPADIATNVEAGLCGAHVSYTLPTATDNCSGVISVAPVNSAYAPGSLFPVGSTTVQLRATDAAGNSSTCSFTVTVTDNIAPSISCPADIATNVEAGLCGAHVSYTLPTATDNCSGVISVAPVNSAYAPGSLFPVGTTTVQLRATDAAGNSSTCSFTVTVTDNIAPSISCPADITTNVEAGLCGAHVSYTLPTATDNCGGAVTVAPVNSAYAPGSLFPVGSTTVQLRATDAAGNNSTCTFTVTVTDNIAPSISCPANIATNVEAGLCGAHVTYTLPTATDNCSGVVSVAPVNSAYAPGSAFPVGSTTVQLRATDAAGNSSTCSFTVTVTDNIAPSISCPADIATNVEAGLCGAHVSYTLPNATDNCGGVISVVPVNSANAPGSLFSVGTTIVQLSATDAAGNSSTCSFTITVTDNIAPSISCPADITTNVEAGLCGAHVSYTLPTATDNCSGVISVAPVNSAYAPGSAFPVGSTTVQLRATDAAGNSSTCSFTVTVTDNIAPSISCPADITTNVEAGLCGAHVNYTLPTAADNCGGVISVAPVNSAYVPGSLFPVGSTTVQLRATDAAGNSSTCSFTITVTDNIAPSISCPADITTNVEAGLCGAHVNYVMPSATDNCSGVISVVAVNGAYAPGSLFPVGPTTVQLRATDASGNSSTCSFTITVTDNIAPSISCPADITTNVEAGLCGAHVNYVMPSATDNCGGAISLAPVNSAYAPGSLFPVGTTTVQLRATDAAGNSSTCSLTITVTDNIAPSISCPADIATNVEAGLCGAHVSYTLPNATDNCGGVISVAPVNSAYAPGSLFPVGTTTVQLSATDAAGNSSTCSFTITVTDNIVPSISCPADITTNVEAGLCGAHVSYVMPSATDNCGGVISVAPVNSAYAPGSLFPVGPTTVQLRATDASGNSSTCSFTITVTDNIAPSISCPADIATNVEAALCGAHVSYALPTATDNCGGLVSVAPVNSAYAPASLFPVGTTTVQLRATDASGNSSTCSFTITVTDNIAPSISCPADIATNVEAGLCGAHVNYTLPTATDNCGGVVSVAPVNSAYAPGSLFPVGTTTVQLRATDAAGNSSTCSFTVTVTDNIAPSISCPADITTNVEAGLCGAHVSYALPTATDNCSGVISVAPVNSAYAPGSAFPVGSTTVQLRATDAAGNSSTCSFTVTVTDNIAPSISCPADITTNVEAGLCGAHVSYVMPSATDNCGGVTSVAPVNSAYASGELFPVGTTTVQLRATDAAGNSNLCTFLITVSDTVAPALVCPNDTTLTAAAGSCGAILDYVLPQATDNCTAVPIVVPADPAFAPGAVFPIGTSAVTWTATDASGNSASCTFQATVIAPTAQLSYGSTAYCTSGATELPLAFTPAGGYFTAEAGLVIDPNTGAIDPAVSDPGAYTVHYQVDGDCGIDATFPVSIVTAPQAGNAAAVSLCGDDAPIDLLGHLGGTPDPNGAWSGPSTVVGGVFDPASMLAGDYTYSVAGSAPCPSASAIVTVHLIAAHDASFQFGAADHCVTEGDIAPVASETGGTYGSASGLLIDANTGMVHLSGSAAGSYTITHIISGACGDTATWSITVHSVPVAQAGTDQVLCGTTTALAASGDGTWSAPAGIALSSLSDAHADVQATTPGTYALVWTVQDGPCTAMDTVRLTFVAPVTADAGTDQEVCGLTAILAAQGTGQWSSVAGAVFSDVNDPNATVSVNAEGAYTFTWTTSNGPCVASDEVHVILHAPVHADAGSDLSTCGTTAQLQAAGVGLWSLVPPSAHLSSITDPQATIAVDTAGTYTLRWIVRNGTCADSADVHLAFALPIEAHAGNDQEVCGYTAQLEAQGVGTWSGPANAVFSDVHDPLSSVTVDAQGSYTFQWTVTNGSCVRADDVSITFDSPVSVAAGADQSVCASQTQLAGIGSGTWGSPAGGVVIDDPNDPNTLVTALYPGTYLLSWMMVNGACSGTDEVLITFHPTVEAHAGADASVCGMDAQLDAQGEGSWTLPTGITLTGADTANATVHADAPGSYTLTWTATNGVCSSSDDVTIAFFAPITVGAGEDQHVCGNTAQLAATGTGAWTVPSGVHVSAANDALATASTDQAGTYDLVWSAANGACVASDTVSITFNQTVDASFTYGTNVLCTGGDDLTPNAVTSGGTYAASPAGLAIDPSTGVITAAGSSTGTYNVTYSIDGACPAQSTATLTVSATADASWNAPSAVCSSSAPIDLSTLVTGTSGGNWSGNGVSGDLFDPTEQNGSVVVTYTVGSGACAASLQQAVVVTPAPVAVAGADQDRCTLEATLEATLSAGSGTWSGPQDAVFADVHNAHTTVQVGSAGIHTFTWTVQAGMCQSTDEVTIRFFDPSTPIWAHAGDDQQLDIHVHTDLGGEVAPGATAQWSVASGHGVFDDAGAASTAVSELALGDNYLVLTASIGSCLSVSDTVVVHVNDLFIPQGFSPNGDGVNETFAITGIQEFPGNTIEVFDRWGKRVFEATDYANDWDGHGRAGGLLPNDTYFYLIKLTEDRTYQGYVIIKR